MRSWVATSVSDLSSTLKFPQIRLTDSASTQKKPLAQKDLYRLYVCGITPYDATHLGHAATYLSFDLIHRYLVASGSTVNYVQNITDIDEPLLERADRDGVEWENLASEQIELFRKDMSALNVLPPTHYIGAIEAIPLVVEAIENLSDKNSTYEIDKDVYFSVKHDSNFANISHLKDQEMIEIFSQRGGDPTLTGKKDPLDCLVWMLQRPNEPGWNSSYGFGRPGWHIECTAIALNYLAPDLALETLIDIQGGGSDLIFPHHEMCAAQARVITGKELASHYVHAGMIGLDGEKMSKSKGNLVFVSSLLASGVDPFSIRWALMSDHFRKDRMWSQEKLTYATHEIQRLRDALQGKNLAPTENLVSCILDSLANDLDTKRIVLEINQWVDRTLNGETGGDKKQVLLVLENLLGFSTVK
jgi:L-cysteine:1D-myo-inositol 2-amino-2-deoxy-alpha-D-glucopyranoside ligase